jgi:hypothetical protein
MTDFPLVTKKRMERGMTFKLGIDGYSSKQVSAKLHNLNDFLLAILSKPQ